MVQKKVSAARVLVMMMPMMPVGELTVRLMLKCKEAVESAMHWLHVD